MVLKVDGITVLYGSVAAVTAASITAESGSVTAVIGPNGAGKSSLFSAIYGSTRSSGRIRIGDIDISKESTTARGRRGFAYVPQGRQLFMKMSVVENLAVGADLLGLRRSAIDVAMDRFPVLRERASSYAGVLSGGEQQMLVLARALLTQPKVLLLDEMTTGLAPKIVAGLRETVRELASSGVAVLIAEPALTSLKSIVDRGFVMQRGRIAATCEDVELLDTAYRQSLGMTESITNTVPNE